MSDETNQPQNPIVEPQTEVVSVPLSPEMQRAMEAAQKLEATMDAELERLLTPEGRRRLADAEVEISRRALFGDGSADA